MAQLGFSRFFASLFLFFIAFCGRATESETQAPDFKEVYELIRTHVAGMSEADLNRTAVQALVSALGSKVSLAGPETSESGGEKALVSKSALFEGKIGYLRINEVGAGLEKALREAYEKVGATNKLNGLVIDLRYAMGDNYAAAAATADLFLKREQPLMDWGQGMIKSKEKSDAISLPISVLINGETAGAAEALAAVLREAGTGLILGNKSAGRAMIAQEYPLQNGGHLRIATAPLQLGDGSALPLDGLKPDILVEVNSAQERIYYADAFKEFSKSNVLTAAGSSNTANSTNRNRRPRFNEAELVRERRDGFAPDLELSADSGDNSDKPAVRDPVLARGLDVLKGLAVVRQSHS